VTPEGPVLDLAQTAPSGGGASGVLGFFLPLAAMFLLLYALVIRPQSRQQKEHKKMLTQIQRGDYIVTSGGLHGRVTGIADDVLTVEIAEQVRAKIDRSAVARRRPAAEGKEKEKEKEKLKERKA
jgi:preprotein translocase subunit YajC